ncbi:MAG: hypothetical protein QNJ84_02610 [Alphaproteobacteria bacterium]|nr:hypothetical protein [Alphaproteobacteria bacterium]
MHMRRETVVAIDPIASELGLADPESLIDDMAQPFLDIAERLEAARLNDVDAETWAAILDTNVLLWKFIANYLPTQLNRDMPAESTDLLRRIADFMSQSCTSLRRDRDEALTKWVIELNLNMCEQVLSEQKQRAEAAAA